MFKLFVNGIEYDDIYTTIEIYQFLVHRDIKIDYLTLENILNSLELVTKDQTRINIVKQ